MIKQPSRGQLLELWNLLEPNRGYSSKEIEKIAQEHQLNKYTASNLMTHGIKQKYLYLYENHYYRSDSTIGFNTVISESHIESYIETNSEKISQNWPELYFRARQRKEEIIKQKKEIETQKKEIENQEIEIEREEKAIDLKIADLEVYYKSLANFPQQLSKASQ